MLLPAIAFAECGFAMSGGTMMIVVGKKGDKCFSSGEFAETFKSTVATALAESDDAEQKKAFDDRDARGNKLWAIAERQHRAAQAGGRYFGQKY
jgi:hypothetical protein